MSEDGGTHGLTADSVAQALRHEPRSLLALLLSDLVPFGCLGKGRQREESDREGGVLFIFSTVRVDFYIVLERK